MGDIGEEPLAHELMIQACMEHSVMELIRRSSESFSDWWFSAHLADLLTRMGLDWGASARAHSHQAFREVLLWTCFVHLCALIRLHSFVL